MAPLTLRKALTQAKSSMPCKIPRTGVGNTQHESWKGTDDFGYWRAFSIENLNASYGHILDAPIPEGQLDVPDPRTAIPTREMTRPYHIYHLVQWNQQVLKPTLDRAKNELGLATGTSLNYKAAHPDKPDHRHNYLERHGNTEIKHTHLIELLGDEGSALVVGLAKPSCLFSGRALLSGFKLTEQNLLPLRQLAFLCHKTKTRFGYILTDEALLACCFSRTVPGSIQDQWSVQMMPVDWSKAGETQLTTDLALWWLCMLALSGPENRKLTIPAEMAEIDAWEPPRKSDDERGWVERHKYSKYERVYQTPSPNNLEGQLALSQAGAGLHADPVAAENSILLDFDFDSFLA